MSHLLTALAALAAGCAGAPDPADWATVREVTPEFLAQMGSQDAALAADTHGRVALTFVTRDSLGKNLWLSVSKDSGVTFAPPVQVNLREGRVDSYPESRPAVVFGPGGELAIAWSERRDSSEAVDFVVRASGDAGATLGVPAIVNDDRPGMAGLLASRRPRAAWRRQPPASGYHQFPALTFLPDGSLFAAWLDGREDRSGEAEPPYATIYSSLSMNGGQSWNPNLRLADSVCSCCRPAAASDAAGRIAVAYRSAASNFRDPALAVSLDRGASFPLDTVISADRWRLEGCPAQGPALTWNRASGGMLAWFTGAVEEGVYLMPWHTAHGAAGLKRPLLDSLASARSPRLAAWEHATWIAVEGRARSDTTRTVLAVRALDDDGSLTPWSFLGSQVRAGWIVATDARTALACWTEREPERTRVRVVRLKRRPGPA